MEHHREPFLVHCSPTYIWTNWINLETKLIPENTRGKQRARNHEYEVANARAYYAKREGKLKNQKSGSKFARSLPSKDTNIELQKAKICALC